MHPIVIAASPLTYAEYKKLMFADLRARHPFQFVFLPILSLVLLIVVVVIIADEGITAAKLQEITPLLLMPAGSAFILIATLLSLRQKYRNVSDLSSGTVYRLNEQEIVRDSIPQEPILWSNIARTARQSGKWILLRQAAHSSSEIYFLSTTGVLPPANREELLSLLRRKRIKSV